MLADVAKAIKTFSSFGPQSFVSCSAFFPLAKRSDLRNLAILRDLLSSASLKVNEHFVLKDFDFPFPCRVSDSQLLASESVFFDCGLRQICEMVLRPYPHQETESFKDHAVPKYYISTKVNLSVVVTLTSST